jgi:pSer/pThr/pTyr-binding forkhead associated (FHA) protein
MSTHVTLTVTGGPLDGHEFECRGRTLCTIGRSSDCDLCLTADVPDLTISRRHCLLEVDPPFVRLHDLGSRNGTFVNGEAVGRRRPGTSPSAAPPADSSPRTLQDGDRIRLGGTTLLVDIDEKEDGEPKVGHEGEGTNESFFDMSRAICC